MKTRAKTRERRQDTLEYVIQQIDAQGEHQIRLTGIARERKLAPVTLLRWFDHLDGMLDAAHIERLARSEAGMGGSIAEALRDATNAKQAATALDAALLLALSPEGVRQRAIRSDAMGVAVKRRELAAALGPRLAHERAQLAEAIAIGQQRGWVPATRNPLGVATMLRSQLFGLRFIDLHPRLDPQSTNILVAFFRHAIHALVLGTPAKGDPLMHAYDGGNPAPPKSADVPLDDAGERVIDVLTRTLDLSGERAIKAHELANMAEINVSQMYRRFGSLEGAIMIAQARRLGGLAGSDSGEFQRAIKGVVRERVPELVQARTRTVASTERRTRRLTRLTVVGASYARESLQAVAAAVHGTLIHSTTESFEALAKQASLAIDPAAVALWNFATIFGLTAADLEPNPPKNDEYLPTFVDLTLDVLGLGATAVTPASSKARIALPKRAETNDALEVVEIRGPENKTRNRVLEAAFKVLLEHGHGGFTIGRIAQRAGVHDSAVSYYFRSPEVLAQLVAREALERIQRHIDDAIVNPATQADWPERLIRWVVADATRPDSGRLWPALWSMANGDSAIANLLKRVYEDAVNQVLVVLGHDPQDPATEPLRNTVYQLALVSEGLIAVHGHRDPDDPLVKTAEALTIRTLAPILKAEHQALAKTARVAPQPSAAKAAGRSVTQAAAKTQRRASAKPTSRQAKGKGNNRKR